MIAHYFKLIWKRRTKNTFLFIQLIVVFWVVFSVFSYGVSKYKYYSTPLGYSWKNMYRAFVDFESIADTTVRQATILNLKRNLEAIPEIEEVSYSVNVSPYLGNSWGNGNDHNGFKFNARYMLADYDYFSVWKVPLKSGRYYAEEDKGSKYIPLVVNQKFVQDFLQGKEPIGFKFNFLGESEIVGVIENFKFQGDFTEEEPFIFVPIKKEKDISLINMRVKEGSNSIVEKKINDLISSTIKSNDYFISKVETSRTSTNNRVIIPLAGMAFLAIFLIINIAMGLFGVLRYTISKRKSEIGLRKALGATNSEIKKQFVGEIVVLVTLALLVALFFAVQLPFITTLPFSTENYISGIVLGTILVYFVVFVCSYFPSREAAQTLPANALHEN